MEDREVDEEDGEIERQLFLAILGLDFNGTFEIIHSNYRPEFLMSADRDGWSAIHYLVWSLAKASGLCDDTKDGQSCPTTTTTTSDVAKVTDEAMKILTYLLLPSGFDVTASNASGVTVLHMAAHYGLRDIVELGIREGCDVNARADDFYKTRWKTMMTHDPTGACPKPVFPRDCDLYRSDAFCIGSNVTPLYLAARSGHDDVIRTLARSGADVEAGKSVGVFSGIAPLHAAAAKGNLRAIDALLQCGCDVNARASDGGTALLCAVEFDRRDVVVALLRLTDVDGQKTVDMALNRRCPDLQGGELSAVHLAVSAKSERILDDLIRAGADVNARSSAVDGFTPLHMAVQADFPAAMRLLIAAGCDVNAAANVDDYRGLTALHLAIRTANTDVIDGLFDAGADVNALVKVDNVEKVGLLHMAAVVYDVDVTRRLIELGCDVDALNSIDCAPIFLAVKSGNVGVAQELLSAGCSLQIPVVHRSRIGLLHLAVMHDSEPLVRALHGAGCDVDEAVRLDRELVPASVNCNDRQPTIVVTPLLLAVVGNSKEMSTFLLTELGCDVNRVVDAGFTALHASAAAGSVDQTRLLLSAGARVNQTTTVADLANVTALQMAVVGRHEQVVRALIDAGASLNVAMIDSQRCFQNITPLHSAVENRDLDMVRMLVDAGADVNRSCDQVGSRPRDDVNNRPRDDVSNRPRDDVSNRPRDDVNNHRPRDDVSNRPRDNVSNRPRDNVNNHRPRDHVNNRLRGQGWTPLHTASRGGSTEIVKILLNGDQCDVSSRASFTDDDDVSHRQILALHLAAEAGHADIVRMLAAGGSEIDGRVTKGTKKGFTALHLATETGRTETVRELVRLGCDVNATTDDGRTALHGTAERNQVALSRILLSAGANVDACADDDDIGGRRKKGARPLHLASEFGHNEIVKMLLSGGGGRKRAPDVNATAEYDDRKGVTALHLASANGHHTTVGILVDNGALIDAVDCKDGLTPLHLASQNGHLDVVRGLISRRCSVVKAAKPNGCVSVLPIHLAAERGHSAVIKFLAAAGSPIDAGMTSPNGEGFCPLHLAAESGRLRAVQTLIKLGCDVNKQEGAGFTALHLAVKRPESFDVIEHLLASGADWSLRTRALNGKLDDLPDRPPARNDVTPTDRTGARNDITLGDYWPDRTRARNDVTLADDWLEPMITSNAGLLPLHVAAKFGNRGAIKRLLAIDGSDVDSTCTDEDGVDGVTSLHLAVKHEQTNAVRFLMKIGCDATIRSRDGKTARDLAVEKGLKRVVKHLLL